ncbi:MAG: hypothetical protein ACRDVP_06260 [Acidimicrobiales bacterium]
MRLGRFVLVSISVVVVVGIIAAPPIGAATPRSGSQLAQQAVNAMRSVASEKVTGTVHFAQDSIGLDLLSGSGGRASGTVRIREGVLDIVTTGKTDYLKANAAFFAEVFGDGAPATLASLAGKWLKLPSAGAPGGPLGALGVLKRLTTGGSRAVIAKGVTFKLGGSTRLGGAPARLLDVRDGKAGWSGKVWIARSGPPYILKVSFEDVARSAAGTLSFSHLGVKVAPSAPRDAINIQSVLRSLFGIKPGAAS